jgi:hypothetical protein
MDVMLTTRRAPAPGTTQSAPLAAFPGVVSARWTQNTDTEAQAAAKRQNVAHGVTEPAEARVSVNDFLAAGSRARVAALAGVPAPRRALESGVWLAQPTRRPQLGQRNPGSRRRRFRKLRPCKPAALLDLRDQRLAQSGIRHRRGWRRDVGHLALGAGFRVRASANSQSDAPRHYGRLRSSRRMASRASMISSRVARLLVNDSLRLNAFVGGR